MARLVFRANRDGLRVDVLIGVDGATSVAQLAAGQPIAAPIHAHGEIDTGSNMTAVSAAIRQRLGVPVRYQAITQTASGSLAVDVFEVSVGVYDSADPSSPELVESTLSVMELPTSLAGIDVLLGLDYLLNYTLVLNAPARQFSLES